MFTPDLHSESFEKLPDELLALTEKVAEHVHNVWAQARIEEGWTYGPARDDTKKETPCLVPYNELPESEKEYDRATASETLRFILSLGWKIVPQGKGDQA